MSEIEETEAEQTPKGLRDYADKTKAENAELRKQLAGLQKELRGVKYGETFKVRNVPPKVADLIPADADVEAWLDEYGFAKPETPAADNAAPVSPAIPNTPAGIDPAVVQAMAQMQQAEAGAIPLSEVGAQKILTGIEALASRNLSGDELRKAIAAL